MTERGDGKKVVGSVWLRGAAGGIGTTNSSKLVSIGAGRLSRKFAGLISVGWIIVLVVESMVMGLRGYSERSSK